MRRILSLFLALHWMIVFAALAILCAFDRQGGFQIVLNTIGIAAPTTPSGLPPFMASHAVPTFFASGFGIVAVLFLWTLLTALFEDEDEDEDEEEGGADDVARLAFGGAIGMVTALFLACALAAVHGFYAIVALELAALAASWLAISAEKRMMEKGKQPRSESAHNAVRLMALDAAHNSLLRRLQSQILHERRPN